MTGNRVLGTILCLIGAVLGIVLTPLFFIYLYEPLIAAEASLGGSAVGCAAVVVFIFPAISDMGVIAGVMYALSVIGFISDDKHTFKIAIIANVLALQASFWPIIPLLVTGLPPLFAILFLPNLIIFFLLMGTVGRLSLKTTLLGLITGMAWVLTFMNGVASTNRLVVLNDQPIVALFITAQRLNWGAAIAWGIVTVGVAINPKEWIRKLGLGAGILEIAIGYPSGVFSPFGGGFSLFLLAPMISTLLVIILISPKVWTKLVGSRAE
ncbi:MAG: hypothetical protein ACFFE4_13425 [Candidatus Thorarchaeota archaeon]